MEDDFGRDERDDIPIVLCGVVRLIYSYCGSRSPEEAGTVVVNTSTAWGRLDQGRNLDLPN